MALTPKGRAHGQHFTCPPITEQDNAFHIKSPKPHPRSDLKALMNSLMAASEERPKRVSIRVRDNNLDSSNNNRLQDALVSPKTIPRPKQSNLFLQTLNINKTPSELTLRDKRLKDAEFYRSFQARDSSDSQERSATLHKNSLGHSLYGKSYVTGSNSPQLETRKTDMSLLLNSPLRILTAPDDVSEPLSREFTPKEHYFVQQTKKLGDISMTTSYTSEKLPKLRDRDELKEKEEWKSYYSKAADPSFDAKSRFRPKSKNEEDKKEKKKRNGQSNSPLHNIKAPYSKFINKNFDGSMVDRLETFGAFAFTSVEREDNKEIPAFLNETKTVNEPLGSMGVVDLWSHRLVNELAKRAHFYDEKRKVEKFAFYRAKELKAVKTKKPQFMTLHRKHENIYRDLMKRQEFVEFKKKNDKITNMSEMQRHLGLQGKTFYKGKEQSNDPNDFNSEIKDIQGEFMTLFNELNHFAEENQDDYLKLLQLSNTEKKKQNMNSNSTKRLEQLFKQKKQQKEQAELHKH